MEETPHKGIPKEIGGFKNWLHSADGGKLDQKNSQQHTKHIEDKLKEFDKLKNAFNRLYEIKGKGAIFRSEARWVEYGEKPTKYFFNMEKKSYNKKVISELKRSDGKTIVNEQDIMTSIQTFYENLYSSDIDHSRNGFYDFGCDLQFAKLSDEKINLDGEITVEESETLFNTFQNGKSPEDDGYKAEFYKQFFSLLGQNLVSSFNAAFDISELFSVSAKRINHAFTQRLKLVAFVKLASNYAFKHRL